MNTDKAEARDPSSPGSGTVTIYHIAEAAGVSPSTVSRVFSRPDRVSFTTAEKIRTIAHHLGYRTSLETRGATRQNNNVLGFIAADLSNQFFVKVLRGASHAGWTEDVWIHASDVQESAVKTRASIEKLVPHVDGLILASARLTNAEIQKVARTTPTVVVNRPVPGVPSVLVDNYDGTIRLGRHLADQGARSVLYLSWPSESWADSIRWRGLRDAAGPAEKAFDPDIVTRRRALPVGSAHPHPTFQLSKATLTSPDAPGGRRAFTAWKAHPTDAVVCFNDMVAAGFLHQAALEGISVPEDVLVAGYDNAVGAGLASPALTTVAGPLRAVGRVAAANLIALIQGLKKPMAKPRVLPARVIVRASTSR